MGIVACTVGAGLPCLCVADAIRLGATDGTFRRRAVRGWLIATSLWGLGCAVLPVAASFSIAPLTPVPTPTPKVASL